jgi:hypothetical protein
MVPARFLSLYFDVDVGRSMLMSMFDAHLAYVLEPLDRELFDWVSEMLING